MKAERSCALLEALVVDEEIIVCGGGVCGGSSLLGGRRRRVLRGQKRLLDEQLAAMLVARQVFVEYVARVRDDAASVAVEGRVERAVGQVVAEYGGQVVLLGHQVVRFALGPVQLHPAYVAINHLSHLILSDLSLLFVIYI